MKLNPRILPALTNESGVNEMGIMFSFSTIHIIIKARGNIKFISDDSPDVV